MRGRQTLGDGHEFAAQFRQGFPLGWTPLGVGGEGVRFLFGLKPTPIEIRRRLGGESQLGGLQVTSFAPVLSRGADDASKDATVYIKTVVTPDVSAYLFRVCHPASTTARPSLDEVIGKKMDLVHPRPKEGGDLMVLKILSGVSIFIFTVLCISLLAVAVVGTRTVLCLFVYLFLDTNSDSNTISDASRENRTNKLPRDLPEVDDGQAWQQILCERI